MVIGLTTPNTHPTAFDPAAFITQQIMAISGIVLLLLGSRITHFYHRYRLREMGKGRHPSCEELAIGQRDGAA